MRLSRWWKCCITMELKCHHTPSLPRPAPCLKGVLSLSLWEEVRLSQEKTWRDTYGNDDGTV